MSIQSDGVPNDAQGNSIQFPERFIFHGNAVAAGGFTTKLAGKSARKVITVQGQSSLPTIGGHSESVGKGSDKEFANLFSHGEVRSKADGILNKDGALTTLSASVENLRMVNRPLKGQTADLRPIELTAERLSLDMRSTYPRKGPPRIEFSTRPRFQGITFDNLPVKIQLRQDLLDLADFAELQKKFKGDKEFFADTRSAFLLPDQAKELTFGDDIPRMNGYAVTSIVRSIRWGKQDIDGHVLSKVGFGSIFFGEMLINRHNRRVMMMRVKLGCDAEGEFGFVEGDPDGTWIPPLDQ